MNQKDIIYMTKNQEVQENRFIMMAMSNPGVILAITIISSSVIFNEYQGPLQSYNEAAFNNRTWIRERKETYNECLLYASIILDT